MPNDVSIVPVAAVAAPASAAAPRYLRFVTALVLGAAVSSAPFAAGCDSGEETRSADAAVDAAVTVDATDATTVVDGPLAPPDLPLAVA